MLRWAFIFMLVALVAGAFGFTGTAGTAAGIAKGLFYVAAILFSATVIAGLAAGSFAARKLRGPSHRDETHHDTHLTRR